jgi:hypothetical protein
MKRKSIPDVVYRKVGRRYEEIGHTWRGFPSDGIWLVQDGRRNMRCLIGLREEVPTFALNYRLHELELCKRIQDKFKEGNLSLMDEARICCDYFAEAAEEYMKNEWGSSK